VRSTGGKFEGSTAGEVGLTRDKKLLVLLMPGEEAVGLVIAGVVIAVDSHSEEGDFRNYRDWDHWGY
jgi:hypothetical protein